MSAFNGKMYPGAMRDRRAAKRLEAEDRDAALPQGSPKRRRNPSRPVKP